MKTTASRHKCRYILDRYKWRTMKWDANKNRNKNLEKKMHLNEDHWKRHIKKDTDEDQ